LLGLAVILESSFWLTSSWDFRHVTPLHAQGFLLVLDLFCFFFVNKCYKILFLLEIIEIIRKIEIIVQGIPIYAPSTLSYY
jgi:hypothetical protein